MTLMLYHMTPQHLTPCLNPTFGSPKQDLPYRTAGCLRGTVFASVTKSESRLLLSSGAFTKVNQITQG